MRFSRRCSERRSRRRQGAKCRDESLKIAGEKFMDRLATFGLSIEQVNSLENYSSLILRWNKRIQMTATRDLQEFVGRHIVDSLELSRELPPGRARMLDVGSGGGLPGIVLAIARPDIDFTLIEPTQKKHAFLRTARRELQLDNMKTLAVRDEEFREHDDFEFYDYAVARAVWALELWMERARLLVRPGGLIFGMEGREESELPEGARRHRYQLEAQRSRSIVILRTDPEPVC
jgi:16S rRNA (guanine527-N7)-methyltransferase